MTDTDTRGRRIAWKSNGRSYVVTSRMDDGIFAVDATLDGEALDLREALQASPDDIKRDIEALVAVDGCRSDGVPMLRNRDGEALSPAESDEYLRSEVIRLLLESDSDADIQSLLRSGCAMPDILRYRNLIAENTKSILEPPRKDEIAALCDDLTAAANAAAGALESLLLSFMAGKKIQQVKFILDRIEAKIGPNFGLLEFPGIDLPDDKSERPHIVSRCRHVSQRAGTVSSAMNGDAKAQAKLRKSVSRAASTRLFDTVITEMIVDSWSKVATQANEAVAREDYVRETDTCDDMAPVSEINGSDERQAGRVASFGEQKTMSSKLINDALLLQFIGTFASRETEDLVRETLANAAGGRPPIKDMTAFQKLLVDLRHLANRETRMSRSINELISHMEIFPSYRSSAASG